MGLNRERDRKEINFLAELISAQNFFPFSSIIL